ncbi:MAG: PfkB family carbohydrate kinase, partial [Myxococcota bacterium]
HGASVVTQTVDLHVPAPKVQAIDTTGAGDAFLAALLRSLALIGRGSLSWGARLDTLPQAQWQAALTIANSVAAQVCTQLGATTGLPHADSIDWSRLVDPKSPPTGNA